MLKYLTVILAVLFAVIYLFTGMFWLRIIGYIMVTFGVLVFILAGAMEEGYAMWEGWPGGIAVGGLLFVLGLVLIFIPL